jgi:hypothetical protein
MPYCLGIQLKSLILLSLLVVACHEGPMVRNHTRPKAKSPDQPACAYFTAADASMITKQPMRVRAGNPPGRCTYESFDGQTTIDFQVDPPAMVDFFRGKPNVESLTKNAVWNSVQNQFAIAKEDREIFGTLTGLGKAEAAKIVTRVAPRL